MSDKPYIIRIVEELSYNPEYGDERECECGHPYRRHFDSYEDMSPVGCKYCGCYEFIEKSEQTDVLIDTILAELNFLKPGWSLSYNQNYDYIRFSNEDGTVIMVYSVYEGRISYMFNHLRISINDDYNLQGYSTESVTAAYNDLKETVQKYHSEIGLYLSKL